MSSNLTSFRLPSAYTIPEHIEHNGQKIPVPPQIRDNVRMLFNGLLDAHQAIVKLNQRPTGTTQQITNITNNSTTISGGVTFNTPGEGYFFGPGIFLPISQLPQSSGASWQTAANRVNVTQFTIDVSFEISLISINVIANALGKFGGFGIYTADGNTLVVDSGPMSLASIAVVTSSIASVTISPGTYFYAQTADTTTATMPTSASVNSNQIALMNANAAFPRYAVAANPSVAGQLPATLGALTATSPATQFDTAIVMFEP